LLGATYLLTQTPAHVELFRVSLGISHLPGGMCRRISLECFPFEYSSWLRVENLSSVDLWVHQEKSCAFVDSCTMLNSLSLRSLSMCATTIWHPLTVVCSFRCICLIERIRFVLPRIIFLAYRCAQWVGFGCLDEYVLFREDRSGYRVGCVGLEN
jgi:hypothetical protein